MKMKKIVPILLGIVFISFGVGIFSLMYNDNFSIAKSGSGSFLRVAGQDEFVRIGPNGIEVRDGNDHVSIGWNGIKVNDGMDQVSVGWDGIKIKENGEYKVNIGGKWSIFGNSSKNLKRQNIDVEEFLDINGVDNINISTPFVDVKIVEENRDDVRVHYHGNMYSNILPTYKFEKNPGGTIDIKIETSRLSGYTVRHSDVVLEVFIPVAYEGNIKLSTTSGDAEIRNISANKFNIDSTSGDLQLENIKTATLDIDTTSGDMELEKIETDTLDINTTSGEIGMNDFTGKLIISTTSGDMSLKINSSNDIKLDTVSGDIVLRLGDKASYTVEGKTTSGDFISRINMEVKESSRNRFSAIIGSGDNSLKISTISGDIIFR